jgi:hypothetical protein
MAERKYGNPSERNTLRNKLNRIHAWVQLIIGILVIILMISVQILDLVSTDDENNKDNNNVVE